jgi:hypothetical protein
MVDCGIRPPSGTFTQIERGYTLGLYTFTYVASESPIWTIAFSGTEACSAELNATTTTAELVVTTTAAELAVSELTISPVTAPSEGIGFMAIGSTFEVG